MSTVLPRISACSDAEDSVRDVDKRWIPVKWSSVFVIARMSIGIPGMDSTGCCQFPTGFPADPAGPGKCGFLPRVCGRRGCRPHFPAAKKKNKQKKNKKKSRPPPPSRIVAERPSDFARRDAGDAQGRSGAAADRNGMLAMPGIVVGRWGGFRGPRGLPKGRDHALDCVPSVNHDRRADLDTIPFLDKSNDAYCVCFLFLFFLCFFFLGFGFFSACGFGLLRSRSFIWLYARRPANLVHPDVRPLPNEPFTGLPALWFSKKKNRSKHVEPNLIGNIFIKNLDVEILTEQGTKFGPELALQLQNGSKNWSHIDSRTIFTKEDTVKWFEWKIASFRRGVEFLKDTNQNMVSFFFCLAEHLVLFLCLQPLNLVHPDVRSGLPLPISPSIEFTLTFHGNISNGGYEDAIRVLFQTTWTISLPAKHFWRNVSIYRSRSVEMWSSHPWPMISREFHRFSFAKRVDDPLRTWRLAVGDSPEARIRIGRGRGHVSQRVSVCVCAWVSVRTCVSFLVHFFFWRSALVHSSHFFFAFNVTDAI